LEVLDTITDLYDVEVWLPADVTYPRNLLGKILETRGIKHRVVSLPVFRRVYAKPKHLPRLGLRLAISSFMLLKFRPHVVYVNTAALASLIPIARLSGAEVVLHLHEYLQGGQRKVVLPLVRSAHRVISVSNAVRESLDSRTQLKTKVIYNGFALSEPTVMSSTDVLSFVVASRWNSWKGHATLLAAWDLIKRQDAHLVILGAAPPSGERVNVNVLVAALARPESVTILGEQDDVREILDQCHVVVIPSIRPDPLPTIAIEAAAAGRPAIASRSGGLPEIVLDGRTGWLFEPGDTQALASAIDSVDSSSLQRMSKEARIRYETLFAKSIFDAEILSYFSQMATEPKRQLNA
jgi:glycosyltransferase involved in cell wall biosynthesis